MREQIGFFRDLYRTQLGTTVAIQLQYRVSLIIWLVFTVVEPVIYLVVWSAVARGRGGQVGGFDAADVAAYFLITMVVNHLTFTWIMHEFEFRIRQGMFSPKLLRPVHPIHSDIAENLGYKTLTMVVLMPAAAVLVVLFQPRLEAPAWAIAASVPAILLAFLLRFAVGWTLALAAFWMTRVGALNQLHHVAMLFLSGQIAPLELMPQPVQWLAALLPFRWMVAFPTELAMGRLSQQEALLGLLIQGGWSAVVLVVMARLWRTALARYAAVGA